MLDNHKILHWDSWKRFPHDWAFVRGIHRCPDKSLAIRSFDMFFVVIPNKVLNKLSSDIRWFGTPWRSCDVTVSRKTLIIQCFIVQASKCSVTETRPTQSPWGPLGRRRWGYHRPQTVPPGPRTPDRSHPAWGTWYRLHECTPVTGGSPADWQSCQLNNPCVKRYANILMYTDIRDRYLSIISMLHEEGISQWKLLHMPCLLPLAEAVYIEGILLKGPYLPCVSMAGRALLAGYHRYMHIIHTCLPLK